ncbi:glycosyltransferase WbuB [Arthrobacter psychrolactophilus]|uniref:Glycosyltransferase WbuB n=1 Tax=Arthrobacter psychrolactophilus TaxID=92442 RepID=A0A2V5IZE6_9MICC|nr:glycosyltransferase family 4 protein [Arthrobacter psychrolactophilus]PYI39824.1 glycosyltransferase WbuB [Arthrobacter psychrolactophilus]
MATKNPLKVVVTTRLFAPEVGAAAFRLKALVDGLVGEGADVHVITTTPPKGSGLFKPSYRLGRWPVLRDAGGNVRGYVQYLSFDIPAFFRLLAVDADVVVSEPPPTTGLVVALSSKLRRRPYVYYAADVWTEALSAMDVPKVVKKVMGTLEGFVLRGATKVIAVSDPVAEQVAKFGVSADLIDVVGNGVDTAIFTPQGAVPAAEKPYFVYTGTMSEWQGAGIFIEALPLVRAQYPDAEIRFFGQGTDEDNLKALATTAAPDAVHFGGVIPPAEAAEWIRGAAAALVSIKPDQGYDFAKPTKIYAAAGCGTPVIFAGQGDGAAIIESGRLGMGASYDARAVADAMIAMLADSTLGGSQSAEDRVQWVADNASLQAAGRVAATAVLAAVA